MYFEPGFGIEGACGERRSLTVGKVRRRHFVGHLRDMSTKEADRLTLVLTARIPLEGAADHGVSESIYLRDPDDNGVELYCDKPREVWPRDAGGKLAMYTHHLDLRKLLDEAPPEELSTGPEDL